MLDNIFIIKFTENLTENKKLCKAIGHPKRYYEAYLSHIVFELWPFTTFTGWKINFDKIILISQFIIIQHRRWQKFVKNIPNSKWWQDRVKLLSTIENSLLHFYTDINFFLYIPSLTSLATIIIRIPSI